MLNVFEISAGHLCLFGAYILPLQLIGLLFLLLLASATDIRERRIPNFLVASGITIAVAFHMFSQYGEGAMSTLSGLGIGMATLLPMYALGMMGAGDVKLMGMTGAFLGMDGILGAVIASMAAGGIFALALALRKRMLSRLLINVYNTLFQYHIHHVTGAMRESVPLIESVGNMPYALAITAGTFIQLFFL